MSLDSSSESGSEVIADNDELGLMAQPIPFDGDAFGNAQDYANEDFGQEAAQPNADEDLVEEQEQEEQEQEEQ